MATGPSAAMTTAIRRSGNSGVHMGAELRVVLIALVFLVATDVEVRCITTANAQPEPALESKFPNPALQNFTILQQFEADALNAVLKNWTSGGLNQQLSSILHWSPRQHPCHTTAKFVNEYGDEFYEGAWRGVFCNAVFMHWNATGNYFNVSVTSLELYGSNMSCGPDSEMNSGPADSPTTDQCGFEGIHGVLPSEIGQLTDLSYLGINHHPNLRGEVPLQIWHHPGLTELFLLNNSFHGTLPSILSPSLMTVGINNNHFSGMLEVSSWGSLFSSSLVELYVASNQLYGLVDFRRLEHGSLEILDMRHNNFSGTFSTGRFFSPRYLYLSNNSFTSIQFANFNGDASTREELDTVYLPSLIELDVSDNKLTGSFPEEIFLLNSLEMLNLSGNHLAGSFPVEVIANLKSLDVSRNNFSGSLHFIDMMYPKSEYNSLSGSLHIISQSLNFSWNHFDGNFSSDLSFKAQKLDLSHNYFNHINCIINYNSTQDETLIDYNLTQDAACMPCLEELYMGHNNVKGVFPIEFLKAPLLQGLYADRNHFNVLQLPDVKIENFNLSRFGIFLTNNKLEKIEYHGKGASPYSEFNLRFSNYLFLAGNPLCQNIGTPLLSVICRANQSNDRLPLKVAQISTKTKVIIATSTSTFGLILFIISIYVWRLMCRIQSLGVILREFDKREVKPTLYSYGDIKLATNNFDKRNKLGEGGFGVVYKGILSDGTIVAVKKLTMLSNQILSEFLNEVVVISGLIHRNLVRLKGCCLGNGDQRILVFEYVENKNLGEALSLCGDNEEKIEPINLDWANRFNIIVGIAHGLAYLHEDLQTPVIHRDIKATNILLDKDYNPKIADFGLAYLFPTLKNNESHLTMEQIAGTRKLYTTDDFDFVDSYKYEHGYLAPEYALHGHMSTSLDVFSFGILVLEIICGRKNYDLQKIEEETILQDWAWKLFKAQNGIALIDPRMEHSSLDVEDITHVIGVALACVQFKAASRPRMHEVGHMLLGNMPVKKFLRDLGSGALSFDIRSEEILSWEHNNVSTDELSLCNNSHEIEVPISDHDNTLDRQFSRV